MPKYAPRIPDRIWKQHKEAIVAFYTEHTLDQTIKHMTEKYGFRASENQYTRKLKAWGIEKYHPTRDWAIVSSKKRKRSEEGKDSDVYIRGRKYSKADVEKEIARHVRLGRDAAVSDDVLPDYITVCTPRVEGECLLRVCRSSLLRDLPWYQWSQEIESLVSSRQQSNIVLSARHKSIEFSMAQLAVRLDCDLPQLSGMGHFASITEKNINAYLPSQLNYLVRPCRKAPDNPTLPQLKAFLQRLIFLSTNGLIDQLKFDEICDWMVQRGGENILASLCHLRSPSMRIFAEKVFHSALMAGNVSLCCEAFTGGVVLQNDDPLQRQQLNSYLSEAVYRGHEAIVELLCKAGARPEVEHGWTSPGASQRGLRLPVLRALLRYGADPERMVIDRPTGFPLVNAALNGSLAAVELLVENGCRVSNYIPGYYGTPLQAAAFGGHIDVVNYLIQRGADVHLPSSLQISSHHWCDLCGFGQTSLLTPLQIAARTNNLTLLKILLNHGASVSAGASLMNSTFPHHAFYETTETWEFPQTYKPRYEIDGCLYSPIQYGVLNRNPDLITALLSTGASPDLRMASALQDTPLQISARLDYVEIFELLCAWGARTDAPPAAYNGRTALQGAAESGSWEILLYLLRAGENINAPAGKSQGLTALQAACLHGHTSLVGVLLAHGADPNLGPSPLAGLTAIQAAAAHGDIGTVQGLLTLGADTGGVAVKGGMSALVAGVRHGSLRLLQMLVKHGADVGAADPDEGSTPLLAALRYKSLPVLEFLVRNGSDVNAGGNSGLQSPLRIAASSNWLEAVELLLLQGADVNDTAFERLMCGPDELLLEENPFSPLGWAIHNQSVKMVDLLLKHGANVLATASYDDWEQQSALVFALDLE